MNCRGVEIRLLDWLKLRANTGETCPTNAEIAEYLEISDVANAGHIMRRLFRSGLISVVSGKCRTATIIETGQVLPPRVPAKARSKCLPRKPLKDYKFRAAQDLSRAIDSGAIAARVDHDQAARKAEREHWLDVHQQKYGMPRPRSIDGMIA